MYIGKHASFPKYLNVCMRPLIPNRNPVQRICHSIEMPKHDNTKEKGVALVFPNIMFYGENSVEMVRPVINYTDLVVSFSVALDIYKQSSYNIYINISTSFRSNRFLFRWYTNLD